MLFAMLFVSLCMNVMYLVIFKLVLTWFVTEETADH